MKAKQVLGKDLMLFVGGKAIALATSCKLGVSAETIDTQSKDSGMWGEKGVKKLGWNCSSENCFSADADINGYDKLFALFVAAEPVDIAFGIPANKSNALPSNGWTLPLSPYTGKAIITSLELNAPDGDKATFSVSLDGTGELKPSTAIVTCAIEDGSRYMLEHSKELTTGAFVLSVGSTTGVELKAAGIGKGVTGVKVYRNRVEYKDEVPAANITENAITFSFGGDGADFDCIQLIGGGYLVPVSKM